MLTVISDGMNKDKYNYLKMQNQFWNKKVYYTYKIDKIKNYFIFFIYFQNWAKNNIRFFFKQIYVTVNLSVQLFFAATIPKVQDMATRTFVAFCDLLGSSWTSCFSDQHRYPYRMETVENHIASFIFRKWSLKPFLLGKTVTCKDKRCHTAK